MALHIQVGVAVVFLEVIPFEVSIFKSEDASEFGQSSEESLASVPKDVWVHFSRVCVGGEDVGGGFQVNISSFGLDHQWLAVNNS